MKEEPGENKRRVQVKEKFHFFLSEPSGCSSMFPALRILGYSFVLRETINVRNTRGKEREREDLEGKF